MPRAELDGCPVSGVVVDTYRATRRCTDSLAVVFHSSNGTRRDLTQLAWSIASAGMDTVNVTWIGGSPRRAVPDAYDAVRRLFLQLSGVAEADPPRPLVVVTWSDASLVALTELNLLGETVVPPVAVSLAGVFGWAEGVPEAIRTDRVAIEFFGGAAEPVSAWHGATPFATLGERCSPMRLVSVATAEMMDATTHYHRAARAVGVHTELYQWDGPAMEMIVPRQAAGGAVARRILAAADER